MAMGMYLPTTGKKIHIKSQNIISSAQEFCQSFHIYSFGPDQEFFEEMRIITSDSKKIFLFSEFN